MAQYNISGHTKTITLIGDPVQHSLSPAMHNAAFKYLGLDYVFLAHTVTSENDLKATIEGMRAMGFVGCNVTMPYKTKVLPYLDALSPAAELMGAVNTIVFEDGKAIGHNTDGAGFMRYVSDSDITIVGKTITILGAGGAGSAIYTQAALDGVGEINVFNRRDAFFQQAEEKARRIAQQTGCTIHVLDLADSQALKRSIAYSALLINATRIGMEDCQQSLVPSEYLVDGLTVGDTVYNPRKTKLLLEAEQKGLKILPGLGMLLRQAAIGEHIWTGATMPMEYIEETFFAD